MKKFLAILFTILIFSCNGKPNTSSQIICPDGSNITVRFSRAQDTVAGIREFYEIKLKQHTSEKYTVIKYPNGYFVQLKVPPEVAINCRVIEIKGDVPGIPGR